MTQPTIPPEAGCFNCLYNRKMDQIAPTPEEAKLLWCRRYPQKRPVHYGSWCGEYTHYTDKP